MQGPPAVRRGVTAETAAAAEGGGRGLWHSFSQGSSIELESSTSETREESSVCSSDIVAERGRGAEGEAEAGGRAGEMETVCVGEYRAEPVEEDSAAFTTGVGACEISIEIGEVVVVCETVTVVDVREEEGRGADVPEVGFKVEFGEVVINETELALGATETEAMTG